MKSGFLAGRNARALFYLTLALLAGCAASRAGLSSLRVVPPPPGSSPNLRSQSVMIRNVTDKREVAGESDAPERSIGWTGSVLGQPNQEILLPAGGSVEALMRQTLTNALRGLGYAIETDEGNISSNDIVIDVTVNEFNAWVGPKDGEQGMHGEISTTLNMVGPIGKKQTREISIELGRRPGVGLTVKSWKDFYARLMNDYAREAREELGNLPTP